MLIKIMILIKLIYLYETIIVCHFYKMEDKSIYTAINKEKPACFLTSNILQFFLRAIILA